MGLRKPMKYDRVVFGEAKEPKEVKCDDTTLREAFVILSLGSNTVTGFCCGKGKLFCALHAWDSLDQK